MLLSQYSLTVSRLRPGTSHGSFIVGASKSTTHTSRAHQLYARAKMSARRDAHHRTHPGERHTQRYSPNRTKRRPRPREQPRWRPTLTLLLTSALDISLASLPPSISPSLEQRSKATDQLFRPDDRLQPASFTEKSKGITIWYRDFNHDDKAIR